MSANTKTTRFFSKPLMKQTVKSNLVLALVILVIMAGMSNVVNYAMSVMGSDTVSELSADEKTEAQQDFYTYLYAMASYDEMAQADLSYDDFASTSDKEPYETVFDRAGSERAGARGCGRAAGEDRRGARHLRRAVRVRVRAGAGEGRVQRRRPRYRGHDEHHVRHHGRVHRPHGHHGIHGQHVDAQPDVLHGDGAFAHPAVHRDRGELAGGRQG